MTSNDTGSPAGLVTLYEPLETDDRQQVQVDERTVCKFMLVRRDGLIDLICGPVKEYRYHAMLLDRYCRDNEIPADWAKRNELLEVYDSELEILGGGWIEIKPAEAGVRFFGASTAYGGFDRTRLAAVLDGQPVFDRFEVEIE